MTSKRSSISKSSAAQETILVTTPQPKRKLTPQPTAWTASDIAKLRYFSRKKLSIKEISIHLSRTPESVNKAIDRYKTRRRKAYACKKEVSAPATQKRHYFKDKPRNTVPRPILKMPLVTNIKGIIRWLDTLNIHVKSIRSSLGDNKYYLNGQIYAPHHFLIFANKLRIQKNLSIFHVPTITQF